MDKAHFALHDGRFAVLATFGVDAVQELVQVIFQCRPARALDAIAALVRVKGKAIFLKHFSVPVAVGELFGRQARQIDANGADKVRQGAIASGTVRVGLSRQRGLEQDTIGVPVRGVNGTVSSLVGAVAGRFGGRSVGHRLTTLRLVGGSSTTPVSLR